MTTADQKAPDFKAIASAAAQVKQAIANMNAERDRIKQAINTLNARKQQLQGTVVTPADFREFICDYIDAKREIFRNSLRQQIVGMLFPVRPGKPRVNYSVVPPLNFAEMEKLLEPGGEVDLFEHSWITQLVTPNKGFISDVSFYFYFSEQLKQVIQQEFDSFDIALPSGEKMDRAMLRQLIQEIDQQIAALQAQYSQLASKICQLGGTVKVSV